MRLPRPYIPLAVRASVARRQFREKLPNTFALKCAHYDTLPAARRLRLFLHYVFFEKPCHLDHDPPLAARKKVFYSNGEFAGYDPPANDPDFLVYRAREDHRVKTYVRGEHGQYSDTVLIKRDRKREKKAGKVRKYRWPKRKLKSRSFHAAIPTGNGE
jgi:hypothetical protein